MSSLSFAVSLALFPEPLFPEDLLFMIKSSTNTAINISVDRALILGLIPRLAIAKTVMDKVDTPEPVVKKLTMKSSNERVNANRNPVITPGMISGSITFQKA
jgi:hypothetical protein